MKERRASYRISYTSELWIGQDGVFVRSTEQLTDVSVGGAFVTSPDAFQIGTILNLRFAVGDSWINSTVIVRNARTGYGIGVEFLDLSPEHAERLAEFIIERAAG